MYIYINFAYGKIGSLRVSERSFFPSRIFYSLQLRLFIKKIAPRLKRERKMAHM